MLKRKIERQLTEWKNISGHKPLIVKGCRQCGKTFSVLDFAKKNYKNNSEPSGEVPCKQRNQAGRLQCWAYGASSDASTVYGVLTENTVKNNTI